jgi:myo-inositol-1(or 4)-monophosphatase
MDLLQICRGVLERSQATLKLQSVEIFKDIQYKTKDQAVSEGDLAVSRAIIDYLKEQKFPGVLFDEEAGRIQLHPNPKYTIVTDPIDGTYNFVKGLGRFLPYTTIIGIFEGVGDDLKYKDVVCAGMVEHIGKNIWTAEKGKGCFCNNTPVITSGAKTLEYKSPVLVDFGPVPFDDEKVVPGIRKLYEKLIEKTWVTNLSGAGYHLACVSSGIADAHVLHRQKPDEMTAGYLMINEAGGSVIDWEGKDWGDRNFRFGTQHPAIAGATKELALEILALKG